MNPNERILDKLRLHRPNSVFVLALLNICCDSRHFHPPERLEDNEKCKAGTDAEEEHHRAMFTCPLS